MREHAFEAYLFSLVVRAVREAGGTAESTEDRAEPIQLQWRFAEIMVRLVQRSGTLRMCSAHSGDRDFEIHVDVQYEGTPGAIHEIDVSVATIMMLPKESDSST